MRIEMIWFGVSSAEKASEAYDKGQYAVAYKHFRRLAKRGDGQAARLLGDMHREGEGVKRDVGAAMKWYAVAADMGDDPARRIMGRYFTSTGNGSAVEAVPANGQGKSSSGSPPDLVRPAGTSSPRGSLFARSIRLFWVFKSKQTQPSVRSTRVSHRLSGPKSVEADKKLDRPHQRSVPTSLAVRPSEEPVVADVETVRIAVEPSAREDTASAAETLDDRLDDLKLGSDDVSTLVEEQPVEVRDEELMDAGQASSGLQKRDEEAVPQSASDSTVILPMAEEQDGAEAVATSPDDKVGQEQDMVDAVSEQSIEPGSPEVRLSVSNRELLARLDTQHLLEKAEGGDGEAILELAAAYRVGLGVEKDLEAAASWYRRAATDGSGEAKFQLGRMYLKGTGVRRNRRHAFSWLRRAAVGGHPRAPFELGLQFAEKSRAIPDLINAVAWLSIAYEAGHLSALNMRETVATELSDDYLAEAARVADAIRDEMKSAVNVETPV